MEGSGTAVTASGETAIGAAAANGSKMNVPPAPTAKFVPSGKPAELLTYSVPALTVVPPV